MLRFFSAFSAALLILGSAVSVSAQCPAVHWDLAHQSAGSGSWQTLAIDYDRDGNLDLLTVDGDNSGDATLHARRGNGDGTFDPPMIVVEHVGDSIDKGDINGDGFEDVVAAAGNAIWIVPGGANGFGAPRLFYGGSYAQDLDLGNFDSDPELELVTASAIAPAAVYDNIDGALHKTATVSTGMMTTTAVAGGDFDLDGRIDVALAGVDGDLPEFLIQFGNADGTFQGRSYPTSEKAPFRIVSGHLNDDQRLDLVVANFDGGTASVYRSHEARSYLSMELQGGGPEPKHLYAHVAGLLIADVSGDGRNDVVVGSVNNGGTIGTFLGYGSGIGSFDAPTFRHLNDSHAMALGFGDFDNDGIGELVSAGLSGPGQLRTFERACATRPYLHTESPLISIGQKVLWSAHIAGFGATAPNPRGNVTFRSGSTVLAIVPVDAGGLASFEAGPFAAGTYTITAEFSGNGALAGGMSQEIQQRVTTATSEMIVALPDSVPVYGTPWPVELAIGPSGRDEWVSIIIDGVAQRPQQHTSTTLFLKLPAGPHTIAARFYGSDFDPPSTSPTYSFTVAKATPTLTHSFGELANRLGFPHSLRFTVNAPPSTNATGTVQLLEGTTVIGSAAVTFNAVNMDTTPLSRGAHDVVAHYSGDANFHPASLPVTLSVLPNEPAYLEARGIPGGVHVAFVLPPKADTNWLQLYRRPAGSQEWTLASGWFYTKVDTAAVPGVVYEYMLQGYVGQNSFFTNIDRVLRFHDDLLTTGMPVRRLHLTELRASINLLRASAGLPPFELDASFATSNVVRASHLNALATALAQARGNLGMPAAPYTPVAPGARISGTQIRQLRDGAR